MKVKSKIIEEISEGKENHYALGLVESKWVNVTFLHSRTCIQLHFNVGAVQRYFESRRRNWRESSSTDPQSQERVAHQSLRWRIRSRQQRVLFIMLIYAIPGAHKAPYPWLSKHLFQCILSFIIVVRRWFTLVRSRKNLNFWPWNLCQRSLTQTTLVQWQFISHSGAQKVTASMFIFACFYSLFVLFISRIDWFSAASCYKSKCSNQGIEKVCCRQKGQSYWECFGVTAPSWSSILDD